jgi:hypothetical protein
MTGAKKEGRRTCEELQVEEPFYQVAGGLWSRAIWKCRSTTADGRTCRTARCTVHGAALWFWKTVQTTETCERGLAVAFGFIGTETVLVVASSVALFS